MRPVVKRRSRVPWLVFILALYTPPALAQLQLTRIQGVLLDSKGQPVVAAAVILADPLGATIESQLSDGSGRFVFPGVAPGRYALRATVSGPDPLIFPLTIAAALPLEVTLRLPPRITGTVIVEAPLGRDSVTSRVSVAGSSLDLVPVRIGARGIEDVVATLPGWATEDNGLLHVRGIDDGILYVVDGVPVYERLDQLSGLGPDVSSLESVTVVTGYIPAEFGYKAGGVIDVRSKSAHEAWAGSAQAAQAINEGASGVASAGGRLGRGTMLRVGAVGQRSDRFLDPVHPDNLHNRGSSAGTDGQFTWGSAGRDRVNAGWGAGSAAYEVPNTEQQEAAAQDQRQRTDQGYANGSWQRTWSPVTVSQLSAYARHVEVRLDGSPHDTPLFATAKRSLIRTGAIAALTHQRGSHLVKTGLEIQRLALDERFTFAVTDKDAAADAGFSGRALAFDEDEPFEFSGRSAPTLWSLFLQDAWHPSSSLTVNAGVRLDVSRLLLDRHQWSPRVGAAYRVGSSTAVRGSISRFFQPPQPENLLLSSSVEARALSPFAGQGQHGGADLEPERQWAFEAGVEHWLGPRLRLDTAFWYRAIEQAADPNVFAGTTIIFPNAVAAGRAKGLDVRLEMPRRRGWSGYVNSSVSRVTQTGPISGGLFLEDEIDDLGPGVEFVPDHDQRLVLSGGLSWEHSRTGVSISMTGRHESGTPIQRGEDGEDELKERPGAELVDFDRGRVAPRTVVSLQGDVPLWRSGRRSLRVQAACLNLFDDAYAYNFGNPFSGTHFGAPRTVSLALRVRF